MPQSTRYAGRFTLLLAAIAAGYAADARTIVDPTLSVRRIAQIAVRYFVTAVGIFLRNAPWPDRDRDDAAFELLQPSRHPVLQHGRGIGGDKGAEDVKRPLLIHRSEGCQRDEFGLPFQHLDDRCALKEYR